MGASTITHAVGLDKCDCHKRVTRDPPLERHNTKLFQSDIHWPGELLRSVTRRVGGENFKLGAGLATGL